MIKWYQIKGFPNHRVSNDGQVKVLARRVKTPMKHYRLVPEKLLKPSPNGSKFRYSLSIDNTRKMMTLEQINKIRVDI